MLRSLLADAEGDLAKLKTALQGWFDGSMDRVSGWYKRRAQFVLLVTGLGVAVAVNADTLEIIYALSNDSAVRASVVSAADSYVRQNPQLPSRPVPASPQVPPPNQAGGGSAEPPEKQAAPDAEGRNVPAELRQHVGNLVEELGGLGVPVGWRWTENAKREAAKRDGRIKQRMWPGFDCSRPAMC